MEIVDNQEGLTTFMGTASKVNPEHPVLIDKFLEDAKEIDVDAISDGKNVVVAGIMEHIEEAGIHSGDSAMVLPSISLSSKLIGEIREATKNWLLT